MRGCMQCVVMARWHGGRNKQVITVDRVGIWTGCRWKAVRISSPALVLTFASFAAVPVEISARGTTPFSVSCSLGTASHSSEKGSSGTSAAHHELSARGGMSSCPVARWELQATRLHRVEQGWRLQRHPVCVARLLKPGVLMCRIPCPRFGCHFLHARGDANGQHIL